MMQVKHENKLQKKKPWLTKAKLKGGAFLTSSYTI
jgi:hypothetical protein